MSNAEKMVSKSLSDDLAALFTQGFLDDSMVSSIVSIARKHDAQQHQGEPVAWVHPLYLKPGALGFEASVSRLADAQVPLYTHADPASPFEVLAEHCAKSAIAEGVTNYRGASYAISRDDGGAFELVITMQRLGAKSPQEVNEELVQERDILRSQLNALEELSRDDEVERLRSSAEGLVVNLAESIQQNDTLRAQLAEAHKELRKVRAERDEIEGKSVDIQETLNSKLAEAHALLRHLYDHNELSLGDDQLILAALSASAEPSAPLVKVEDVTFISERGTSAPVKRDERAEFEAAYDRGELLCMDGPYDNPRKNQAFATWQARAALERKP